MRNFEEIMRDAELLPGNTLIVTTEEANICIDRFVQQAHLDGITADLVRRRLLISLCGKQLTVGR